MIRLPGGGWLGEARTTTAFYTYSADAEAMREKGARAGSGSASPRCAPYFATRAFRTQ